MYFDRLWCSAAPAGLAAGPWLRAGDGARAAPRAIGVRRAGMRSVVGVAARFSGGVVRRCVPRLLHRAARRL